MLRRQLWGSRSRLQTHSHQEKAWGLHNKRPVTAQGTRHGDPALHSLPASSVSPGSSCRSEDNQEANVRWPRPARDAALSAGGRRGPAQRELCAGAQQPGAPSLDHIRSHHRQETCRPPSTSTREDIAGLPEREGAFSFSLRESDSRPVAMWKLLWKPATLLGDPESSPNVLLALAAVGGQPSLKWVECTAR